MSRLNGRLSNVGTEKPREAGPSEARNNRRSNVNDERGRRMFAGIQNMLGGKPAGASSSQGVREERRKPKIEEPPAEVLDDVDALIAQISDLNVRSDRSAVQIKRNITHSSLIDTMDEDEWHLLCTALVDTALDQSEGDFVVDLFVSLIRNPDFCEVMSSELMMIASSHIMENGEKPVPAFLSAILCGNWPRQLAKAIDTVNLILYTTVSIVKGWIQVLEDDNSLFVAPVIKEKPPLPPVDSEDDDEEESRSEDEDDVAKKEVEPENVVEREDPAIVNRCALAIFELCEQAQRGLWLRWPTLCDEIYAAIKPAITHNNNLNGDTKARLLSTLMSLNSWTRSRAVTNKTIATQTIPI